MNYKPQSLTSVPPVTTHQPKAAENFFQVSLLKTTAFWDAVLCNLVEIDQHFRDA